MILDNAIGDGQPQTSALTDVFGGEKGIEDMDQICRRNAGPLIRDGYTGIGSCGWGELRGWVDDSVRDLEGDLATGGHRLPRIRHQIHQHLLDLPGVDPDEDRHAVCREREYGALLVGQGFKHVEGMLHHRTQVYGDALGGFAPGKSQKLLNDQGHPLHLFFNGARTVGDLGRCQPT